MGCVPAEYKTPLVGIPGGEGVWRGWCNLLKRSKVCDRTEIKFPEKLWGRDNCCSTLQDGIQTLSTEDRQIVNRVGAYRRVLTLVPV